ncbi:hypothetical protein HDV06_002410 [Boothiomyces sp. JEL0866]|nr:hypothetical protein HDV06_002410 [Boothiomyces sp. JEL0866]
MNHFLKLAKRPQISNEDSLTELFIRHRLKCMKKSPILVAREWEITGIGKGDLVFGNKEKTLFYVVELKYIKTKPFGKRKHVVYQAKRYANIWKSIHPLAKVYWVAVTNNEISHGEAYYE